jgi:hypothetical protein
MGYFTAAYFILAELGSFPYQLLYSQYCMGYFTAVYSASAELGTLSPTNSFTVSFDDPLPQPSTPSHYWGSCTVQLTILPLVNMKDPL